MIQILDKGIIKFELEKEYAGNNGASWFVYGFLNKSDKKDNAWILTDSYIIEDWNGNEIDWDEDSIKDFVTSSLKQVQVFNDEDEIL